MMKTLRTIIVAVFALSACGSSKEDKDTSAWGASACDDYVAALCECNPDSCEDIAILYSNADSDLQDVCSEKLSEAESGDDAICEPGGETRGEAG